MELVDNLEVLEPTLVLVYVCLKLSSKRDCRDGPADAPAVTLSDSLEGRSDPVVGFGSE